MADRMVCSGVVGGCDGDLGDAVARGDAVTAMGGWGPRTRAAETRVPHEGYPNCSCVCVGVLRG